MAHRQRPFVLWRKTVPVQLISMMQPPNRASSLLLAPPRERGSLAPRMNMPHGLRIRLTRATRDNVPSRPAWPRGQLILARSSAQRTCRCSRASVDARTQPRQRWTLSPQKHNNALIEGRGGSWRLTCLTGWACSPGVVDLLIDCWRLSAFELRR